MPHVNKNPTREKANFCSKNVFSLCFENPNKSSKKDRHPIQLKSINSPSYRFAAIKKIAAATFPAEEKNMVAAKFYILKKLVL